MTDAAPDEQSIELVSGKNKLHGSLTLPASDTSSGKAAHSQSASAVVLLLPDSGPLDRNQNSLQVQLNIFNDVAQYLSRQGIASLRFDKRGCGMSKGNFNAAGHSDLLADAQQWLEYLHTRSPIAGTPIFILGHGEGSAMAPQLCSANEYVQGQILLTPFVENFENVIRRQAENALREIENIEGTRGKVIRFFMKLSGNQIAKQKKLLIRISKSRKNTLKIRKQVINAKWIREMMNLDARALYSHVDVPTLIIGGQKDLQCLPEDVGKIAALIEAPVEHHVLENLTHILRPDAEKASVQHYLMLSLEEVDRRVLALVNSWLHQHSDTHVQSGLSTMMAK